MSRIKPDRLKPVLPAGLKKLCTQKPGSNIACLGVCYRRGGKSKYKFRSGYGISKVEGHCACLVQSREPRISAPRGKAQEDHNESGWSSDCCRSDGLRRDWRHDIDKLLNQ